MKFANLISQINCGYKLKKKFVLIEKTNFHFIVLKLLESERFILSFADFNSYFLINLHTNENIKLILFSNKKQLLSYNYNKLEYILTKNFSKNFFILTNNGIFGLKNLIDKNRYNLKKIGGINFFVGMYY